MKGVSKFHAVASLFACLMSAGILLGCATIDHAIGDAPGSPGGSAAWGVASPPRAQEAEPQENPPPDAASDASGEGEAAAAGSGDATQLRIGLVSVFVDDQEHALRFYTETLGLVKKLDIPLGEFRFLTVASPAGPEGIELLLEPNAHPAAKTFQQAMHEDGIPAAVLFTKDVEATVERLRGLGVEFPVPPTDMGHGFLAIFDDTCGNLIQIHEG